MRIKINIVLCVGLLVGLLAGCGGEYDTGPGNGTESVSGQSISGQAIVEEGVDTESAGGHCYHTDTNLYRNDFDGDGNVVIQTRLDGSHKNKIKLKDDFYELITVQEGYLYYRVEEYDPDKDCFPTSIFRVPIGKDNAGYDEIRTEQAEELMAEPGGIENVCVTSRYIYCYLGDGSPQIVKYDLQEQKEIAVDDLKVSERSPEIRFIACGNYMAAINVEVGLFVQNMHDAEWVEVSDNEEIAWNSRAFNNHYFFYSGDYGYEENIRKVDLVEKKEEKFVSKKQLRQAVSQALGLGEKNDAIEVCAVTDMFCRKERCYLQVQVNWVQDEVYHMQYLVLSQGQEETELTFEKNLTECMWSHGTARKGKWMNQTRADHMIIDECVCKENVLLNDAKCYRMMNGKAFLCLYDDKRKKGRVGCYELDTGKFRWLSKKDKEYYEPCYTDPNVEDCSIEDYYCPDDKFTGVYWSPNPFGDEQDGGFEDEEKN